MTKIFIYGRPRGETGYGYHQYRACLHLVMASSLLYRERVELCLEQEICAVREKRDGPGDGR